MKLRSCSRTLLPIPIAIGTRRFWLCGEGKPCRPDLMSDCITPEIEPPVTSGEVHPSLGKPPLRIGTDMKVLGPFAIVECIGIWITYTSLRPVMKLGFVSGATVGTRNVKHIISLV